MPIQPSDVDRLLAPGYLDGLQERSLEEVRASRTELQEAETAVSYLRRLAQGHLDVVLAEQRRRQGDGGPSLVEDLPTILAEGGRTPGPGRLPRFVDPGDSATALAGELDEVADPARMSDLGHCSPEELEGLADALRAFERKVSDRRRGLHERLDAVHGEIVRRYRSGEANVDTLLK